jgi:hypothetical protein
MQEIKPSDMTKLEEFRVWLAANGEHDTDPTPMETGNPPPSVQTLEAENSAGNITPLRSYRA